MLTLQDVTVRIGGVKPLDGMTATFGEGVNGLIGPNGAGKTTTFNVLSGFLNASEGRVRFGDRDLMKMSPHRRARWGVRRMFQQEHVVRELSIRENVQLVAENVGARSHEVDEALERVGLAETSRSAAPLSQLEARKLEFARVWVGAPKLVLLDEPGAGLAEDDAQSLVPLIRMFGERPGTVVILVDHDMEMVRAVCERITVLDFGRVIAADTTDRALADPNVRRAYLGDEDVE